KAKQFQGRLHELRLLGEQEVSSLVQGLEEERSVAAWTIRQKFPPGDRASYEKANMGTKVKKISPLRQEVNPEDMGLGEDLQDFDLQAPLSPTLLEESNYILGPDIDAFPLVADSVDPYAHPLDLVNAMTGFRMISLNIAQNPVALSPTFSKSTLGVVDSTLSIPIQD
ncbi:hypothetical protein K469DRAFT_793701, partial [Zopfia rhizophila CBS 207.26]